MSTTGTGALTLVKGLDTWSLDLTADKVETTEFGATNKTWVLGLRDVKGAVAGYWDDTETKPSTGAQSADGVSVLIYPTSTDTAKYAQGPAWVDVKYDGAMKKAVAVSMTISPNGNWTVQL